MSLFFCRAPLDKAAAGEAAGASTGMAATGVLAHAAAGCAYAGPADGRSGTAVAVGACRRRLRSAGRQAQPRAASSFWFFGAGLRVIEYVVQRGVLDRASGHRRSWEREQSPISRECQ